MIARRAVHSALLLAVVMICLAVLYAVQDAPFLFVVQIIVYTGAVLMLFLFVLMLVGVDSADSLVETLRDDFASLSKLLDQEPPAPRTDEDYEVAMVAAEAPEPGADQLDLFG